MVGPAHSYETDARSGGECDRLFHGTGSDDRAKTVVPIHESGGCVCSDDARHRARVDYVLANAPGIDRKAYDSMGIDTAQVGQHQTVACLAGVLVRYIQFLQHSTTEPV